jgi:hypothetical protein
MADSTIMEKGHGASDLPAYLATYGTWQCLNEIGPKKAWPENWKDKAVMFAVGTANLERGM